MDTVAIFRLQLFKTSEVFIAQQAQNLHRYRPVYVGHKRFGEAPVGAEVVALDDASTAAQWRARLMRSPDALIERLGSTRPALIHAHFAIDAVYALPLARRLDVPLAVTLHGFDVTITDKALLTARSPAWLNYFLHRRALKRRADLFICVSDYIRQQALQQGFPEDRLVVQYMGTKLPTEGAADTPPVPIIAHVARLVEKKGTAFLLDACGRLKARGVPFRLVVIGDGPLRTALVQQAAALGIAEECEFAGPQPHAAVLDLLRRTSVLALPSVTAGSGDAEGLGMVLLEASSLGVAVVGTDNGGIPEAIVDGRTGFIVPQRDPAALADRLEAVVRSPELAAELGRHGREFVAQTFDVSRQNIKLEALWDKLL